MTSVYLMKDNGLLVASVSNDKVTDSTRIELESSLLTGIRLGITATFLSSIDYMVLNDGIVVYYRTFKINDDTSFSLVVSDRKINGTVKSIDVSSKMVAIKMFLQERGRWNVLNSNRDKTIVHDEITAKLHDLFLNHGR